MPFTPQDCIKEIILKTMASLAWQKGRIKQQDYLTLADWMKCLDIEGPEKGRISQFFERPSDDFQRQIFFSELRGLLVFEINRKIIRDLIDGITYKKSAHSPLEKKFLSLIEKTMEKHSSMERLIGEQKKELAFL